MRFGWCALLIDPCLERILDFSDFFITAKSSLRPTQHDFFSQIVVSNNGVALLWWSFQTNGTISTFGIGAVCCVDVVVDAVNDAVSGVTLQSVDRPSERGDGIRHEKNAFGMSLAARTLMRQYGFLDLASHQNTRHAITSIRISS